ncbi:MAG: hypothetical protein AB7U82_34030 [Blastocatellales bacterium]
MNRVFRVAVTVALALSLLPISSAAKDRKKRAAQPKKPAVTKPPLAVINNPAPSYLSGEVNVNVRGDENPIIRLQMVPNGQALVEFPAKDRIFKVNPADPDLVTIEDSPTKESDRYILLRSSKQFLPGGASPQSQFVATSMLVQMTSGMVVTLLIYPADKLDNVVHRCVVRYDRDAIVKARQAAGLAVNLDQRDEPVTVKAGASLQITPVTRTAPEAASAAVPQAVSNAGSAASAPVTSNQEADRVRDVNTEVSMSFPKPQVRATEAKASKEENGQLALWSGKLKWSDSLHGLKVAAQTRVMNANQRQVLVVVQNTLPTHIKIVPSHPELAIQTLDERKRVLQVEPVKPIKVETVNRNGMIAPGEVVRYIVTYEAPILGAKQRLCATIAQINAADEPALVELTSGTR